MKKIRKIIKGYLKNITDNKKDLIEEKAIVTKNKLIYIKDKVKHTILIKEREILLIRDSEEFKNILTFSKNRSILSEYIIKQNNLCLEIEIKTIDLIYTEKEIYIKYIIVDSDTTYEFKLNMED